MDSLPTNTADFSRENLSFPAAVAPAAQPELQLLQWIIGLPAGMDPAVAARAILDRPGTAQPELSPRLLDLLETVAAFPAERLGRIRRRRARVAA